MCEREGDQEGKYVEDKDAGWGKALEGCVGAAMASLFPVNGKGLHATVSSAGECRKKHGEEGEM